MVGEERRGEERRIGWQAVYLRRKGISSSWSAKPQARSRVLPTAFPVLTLIRCARDLRVAPRDLEVFAPWPSRCGPPNRFQPHPLEPLPPGNMLCSADHRRRCGARSAPSQDGGARAEAACWRIPQRVCAPGSSPSGYRSAGLFGLPRHSKLSPKPYLYHAQIRTHISIRPARRHPSITLHGSETGDADSSTTACHSLPHVPEGLLRLLKFLPLLSDQEATVRER